MKKARIVGMWIGIISFSLICYLYDWKLAVLILLALLGNNLEQSNR